MLNDEETFDERQARIRAQAQAETEAEARANVLRQARARANAERQAQARADLDALEKRIAKATTRADLAPYTGVFYVYTSYCWNCKEHISSDIHAQCSVCKRFSRSLRTSQVKPIVIL